jgi:hypothetical protein
MGCRVPLTRAKCSVPPDAAGRASPRHITGLGLMSTMVIVRMSRGVRKMRIGIAREMARISAMALMSDEHRAYYQAAIDAEKYPVPGPGMYYTCPECGMWGAYIIPDDGIARCDSCDIDIEYGRAARIYLDEDEAERAARRR